MTPEEFYSLMLRGIDQFTVRDQFFVGPYRGSWHHSHLPHEGSIKIWINVDGVECGVRMFVDEGLRYEWLGEKPSPATIMKLRLYA